MTTLVVRLPESLQKNLQSVADREGISIDQFVTTSVAEKMSALMTQDYLTARAAKANRELTQRSLIVPRFRFQVWMALACGLYLILNCSAIAEVMPREMTVRRTLAGVRYGLIGEVNQLKAPAPTLFVFAAGIEDMQKQPIFSEVASLLAPQGWISVIVDPPCHGEDVCDGEPKQIDGWRHRLEHEKDFLSAFNAKARAVLEVLIKDGVTDPERVAVCGTSRGGFLAFHFAAAEPRIKAAAGISPVTRLTALREFSATSHREQAEQLDLARLAPKLASRAIWLSIGNNDARVNTDDAIAFTREVVRAAARPDKPDAVIPVELLVAPTPGHTKIDQAHELLATWLSNRFPAPKPSEMGRAIQVDPRTGEDTQDGIGRPVKTIAQAIRLAQPGDTIHLQPIVYRDAAAFYDKSGEPGKPITLDGHGATLDGCDPLDPNGWVEVEPGLFRNDNLMPLTDAIIDRWFFVMDGKLNRMRRCSKGPSEPLKSPEVLKPGEWTFVKDADRMQAARAGYIHGSFWLRLMPGQSLAEAKIEVPRRMASVSMHGQCAHLLVKNLTATRPYNDGFNLSDCRDVAFENIRAIDCADDGISAHGECRYHVDGFTSIGNATGICDTGRSETNYRRVLIRDCIGFDLFFLDTGQYSISDSVVISSAAKAVYLQGRDKPAEPCRLTLNNVLIRREQSENEIRVSANCVLTARRVSFLNLDLQATGGEMEFDHCVLGGTVAATTPRKPWMHLWKDATWRGIGNWYDLGSVRVGQSTFTSKTFAGFQTLTASDVGSCWEVLTTIPSDTGADEAALKTLRR